MTAAPAASSTGTPEHRGFMARLGLARPPHYPALIGWFEMLAIAHVTYLLLMGGMVAWSHGNLLFFGLPLATALVFYTLILLTTRRASVIAYWLCLALLLSPTIKFLRKILASATPWENAAAQPMGLWLSFTFSLGAGVMLLLPANRLWLALRRQELKRAKTARETTASHLYDTLTDDGTISRMSLIIGPEQVAFSELLAPLPEQGWREFKVMYRVTVADKDTVPLIMALRKAAGLYTLPKGDLNMILQESAAACLKPATPDLLYISRFLIDHNISWTLTTQDQEQCHPPETQTAAQQ